MHILIKLVMLDHYLFELNNKQRTQNSCIYLPPQKEEQKQPSYSIACSDFHVEFRSCDKPNILPIQKTDTKPLKYHNFQPQCFQCFYHGVLHNGTNLRNIA